MLSLPTLADLLRDDYSSVKMWTLSISHATQHDTAMADRWKNDMDGILVYVRFGTIEPCLVRIDGTTFSRRVYFPRRWLHFSLKATSI